MKIKKWIIGVIGISLLPLFLAGDSPAKADAIPNTDFEDNSLSSWNKGSQSGSFTNTITGNGTGVTLFSGDVVFNAPSHNAVGSPTLTDGSPNPYYAPAVQPTTWKFSSYGTYGVALQPAGAVSFNSATEALGLTSAQNQAIKALLVQQQQASGLGNPNPTNAAWITKNVTLSAGVTYTMSWNYIGTDYVPFNDGSITSLVPVTGSATTTVNNQAGNYALLGFTNPGTGDYSTSTYGSTGWQVSTYQVSETGEYVLGFAVFNLGDTALSPVLLVDSQPGNTLKNNQPFGAVVPNNPNAPTVAPTTNAPTTTVAESTTTQTPTTNTPTTPPQATIAPIVELVEVDLDFSGGTCLINGLSYSSTTSVLAMGYLYLPGPSECSKDSFNFQGWLMPGQTTISSSPPLIVDPTDGVPRYFVASDNSYIASWLQIDAPIDSTSPIDQIPETSNINNTNPSNELPKTGNGSSTALASLIILSLGIIILGIRRWLII